MILNRTTSCQRINIWQPRWKDRTVLIACYKVGTHNEITFSKTKSMPEKYYISGINISKYPITDNGKLKCYVVPLDDLEVLERE
jgi:hypothetical protein